MNEKRPKRARTKKKLVSSSDFKRKVEVGPLKDNTTKLHQLLTKPDVRKANMNLDKKDKPKTNYPSKARHRKNHI